MDAEAAARRWIDGWTRAWRARDAEAVAAMYAEGAVYASHPFRQPHVGPAGAREYALSAFEDEDLVECRFGEPVATGERAAVEYWAILRSAGREVTLAGTAILRFAADGRCTHHRDYWSMDEGRRDPPPGWGT